MDELDRHGAFSDPGRNPFGGPMTHVAGHEDARNTGFQVKRIPINIPALRAPGFPLEQVLAGNHITLGVSFHDPGQPFGSGNGARIDQQGAGRHQPPLA